MGKAWRLIKNSEADVSDLQAYPAAVAEGGIAGKYILASTTFKNTFIIQKIIKPGMLIGIDVDYNIEVAEKKNIDIAVKQRSGRGGMRPAGTISLDELMVNADEDVEMCPDKEQRISTIIYTSGTTGIPKGVVLTHANLLAENRVAESIIPTGASDKFASLVPFFHVFGLADGCVIPILKGATIVLIPQYAPKKFIKILQKEMITVILAIPEQYKHMLIAAERVINELKLSIRYAISGADKLPDKIIKMFKEKLKIDIIEGYGMTETTAAVAINPPEKIKAGSIGIPGRGVDIRVVDEDNKEVRTYEIGELKIRGDVVTSGYYNLPEITDKVIKDGWLYTGDMGYRDEDGYFFITSRKKDIIIKSGFNISPAEIEKAVCQNEKVKEAVALSFVKGNGKVGIRLYCVLKRGKSIKVFDLMKFCKERLTNYKVPDEIRIINKIPKSLTGKVLRKELLDDYIDQRLIKREK